MPSRAPACEIPQSAELSGQYLIHGLGEFGGIHGEGSRHRISHGDPGMAMLYRTALGQRLAEAATGLGFQLQV